MQVEALPAVPMPGGAKGAWRLVKPIGAGASPALAAKGSAGFGSGVRSAHRLVRLRIALRGIERGCSVLQVLGFHFSAETLHFPLSTLNCFSALKV